MVYPSRHVIYVFVFKSTSLSFTHFQFYSWDYDMTLKCHVLCYFLLCLRPVRDLYLVFNDIFAIHLKVNQIKHLSGSINTICDVIYLLKNSRPFPSCSKSLFRSEPKCEVIDTKMFFFILMQMKLIFTLKGSALSLVLKERIFRTRKWPISWFFNS